MPLIQVPFNAFKEVEKMLKYKFWDKERERSNRAVAIAENAFGTRRRCPLRHSHMVWVGPPHDKEQAFICRWCGGAASEAEIKSRNYDFWLVGDWIIKEIMDLDLQRQAEGKMGQFTGFGDGI